MDLQRFVDEPDSQLVINNLDDMWGEYLGLDIYERCAFIEDIQIPMQYQETLSLLGQVQFFEALMNLEDGNDQPNEVLKSVIFRPALGRYINAKRLEWSIDEGDIDTFRSAAYSFGSSAAIQILIEHQDDISDEWVAELLPQMWTSPNMNQGPRGFTREVALELFTRTGFLSDGPSQPTEPQLIYHGVVFDDGEGSFDADLWDGMAWTTDLDVARHFATGGAVYVTTVQPKDVLARFDQRGEHEWVVDSLQCEIELHEHRKKVDPLRAFRNAARKA